MSNGHGTDSTDGLPTGDGVHMLSEALMEVIEVVKESTRGEITATATQNLENHWNILASVERNFRGKS